MTFRFLITSNSLKELKKCSILFKASKQQKELLQFNRNRYFSKFLNENSILSRQNQNVLFRKKDLCFNYRQQSNQASKPKLRAEKKSFSVNKNIYLFILKYVNILIINLNIKTKSFYHGNH